MYPNKKNAFFLATLLLLVPQMCMASGAAADEKSAGYNVTLLSLVGLIVILLFVIGMLASTLSQLAFVVKDKIKKDRAEGVATPSILKALPIMLVLLVSSVHVFAAPEVKAAAAEYISGIPVMDFYLLLCIIGLELLVAFALAMYIRVMLKFIRNTPELQKIAKEKAQKSWFWDKFNSAAAPEKEKDILLDHNYDGIQELDNSLPPWWKYGFYLTIIVACIYLYRFHVSHTGQSPQEEFAAEMAKGEADKAAYLAKSANNVDENTVTLMVAAGDLANGKETFVKNCAACHLADGGGVVGPNLTDDYWLHGGGIKDIFKTIKYGWQDKGMKSWKDDLSPKQIQEVASYIKSIRGTHPATPKAPQGELYIESTESKTDSTKTPKVATK